jgi:(p)ppGpp synthase/HD superfamily hydrolase
LSTAEEIARKAHEGQTDKSGEPYIGHVQRVANSAAELVRQYGVVDPALVEATGWLHDVIEDSATSADDLRAYGIPETVIGAVDALTKRDGEPYGDAVGRANAHPIARWVKIADNLDNSNEDRLAFLDDATAERLREKYTAARAILNWPPTD